MGKLPFFFHLPGCGLGQLFPAPIGQVCTFLGGSFHAGQHLIPGAVGRGVGRFPTLAGEGCFLKF